MAGPLDPQQQQDPALLPQQGDPQQDPALIAQQPQPGVQKPTPSLYQSLGSMTDEDLLRFKSFYNVRKGQKEITRNVGEEQAEDYMIQVKSGDMSISEAIKRSRAGLTDKMKAIDAAFFDPNVSIESMLTLREQFKGTWNKAERNLFQSHFNAVSSKIDRETLREIKADKAMDAEKKKFLTNEIKNRNYAKEALVDYTTLEGNILRGVNEYFVLDQKGDPIEDKEGRWQFKKDIEKDTGKKNKDGTPKMETVIAPKISQENYDLLRSKLDFIQTEMAKDVSSDTYNQADQYEMQKALWNIAQLLPSQYLRKKSGFIWGDKFIETLGKGYDIGTLRKMFFDQMEGKLVRAKNHLTNIEEYVGAVEEEDTTPEGGKIEWSQFKVPTE